MRQCFSRKTAISLLRVALAIGIFWTMATREIPRSGPTVVAAQPPPPPYCFTGSQPPDLGATAKGIQTLNPGGIQFVSDYNRLSQAAWCSFIALNWAAAGNGAPTMTANAAKPLGTCAGQGSNACSLVWETWRSSDEVYTANPLPCSSGQTQSRVHLLRIASPNLASVNPHAPGRLMRQPFRKPGTAQAINQPTGNTQATGFFLPDRNNTAANPTGILYEARENPSACTTITTPLTVPGTSVKAPLNTDVGQFALYNGASAAKLLPQTPPGFIQFQGSAFEVKPSWYQFPSGGPTPSQLGMISATGTTSSGGTFVIGLTGFHIIWKVFNNSSWMWMTFEYAGNNQYTQPYTSKGKPPNTYFSPTLGNPVNYNYPSNTQANCSLPCAYNTSTKMCSCPAITPPAPVPCVKNTQSNLTNPAPCDIVGTAALTANAQFRQLVKGTPLANYNLVGVQVAPTLRGVNTLMANNQIETDLGSTISNGQSVPSAPPPNPTSSCITCHYLASIGICNNNNGKPYISRNSIFAPNSFSGTTGFTYAGFTGAFPTSTYSTPNTGAPYLSSDFVWSVQEASFPSETTACPAAGAARAGRK